MRNTITTLMAAAFVVATSTAVLAHGRGGPHEPILKPQKTSYKSDRHDDYDRNDRDRDDRDRYDRDRHDDYDRDRHESRHHHHGNHGLICKKVVIKIPKWTHASWGRGGHHGHHGGFIIKKIVIICHRPTSP
jgi:hypothetical protein